VDGALTKTCKVNSCPLPVSRVTDYWPVVKRGEMLKPRWGLCRHHAIAPGKDWMKVSMLINENKEAFELFESALRIKPVVLRPMKLETVDAWLERIDVHLKRLIVPDVEQPTVCPAHVFDAIRSSLSNSQSEVIHGRQ